ncbi:DUF885 domain-containing protein [Croceicoccus gelatinilyticus]|uniref:DUF885 domain-containing protein n=1 Tax=Croceicoccus gelatinilyticus TaxID=2835536 RepID=UPI001BCD8165|nr:DUF885 family protein [Croceicoccus gelatinilyticus]MBS7670125.1 DUF885 family protein [Croceicoccus gelatinilyticus]
MDRRQFLGTGAAAAFLASTGGRAIAATDAGGAGQLDQVMDRILWGDFRLDPSELTYMGLDTGPYAWARSQLASGGMAGRVAAWKHAERMKGELAKVDTSALSDLTQVHAGIVSFTLDSRLKARDHGLSHLGTPYVLSQQDGLYGSVPDFLDTVHPVETAGDAEAYLARLDSFAYALDNETELQRSEAARGFAAPDWSLTHVSNSLGEMLATKPADALMVQSLAKRAADKGIAGDWAARAAQILEGAVYPALSRQKALVDNLLPRTREGDGVWRVPDGDALYADALAYYTTTNLGADEIHEIGLEQVADLLAQLDTELSAAGMTGGTVGERLMALNKRPDQLFADSAEGRVEIIDWLAGRVEKSWQQVSPAFAQLPPQALEVQRVPVAIEVGASTAYYQSPSPDGTRPGTFFLNLYDMNDWPRYTLPAIIFHEGLPGHHLQTGLLTGNDDLHLLLRNQYIGAYSEGWALYSEILADELGMYDGLERAGALQSWLYRAARLVTDTGLHSKRWSREKAIDYFGSTVGYPDNQTRNEIERYITMPGQACSYKIGQNAWLSGRERARMALGESFDIKRFHTLLLDGDMPLALLDKRIDQWIAAEKARLGV